MRYRSSIENNLSELTKVARKDIEVVAIFLFGSAARNQANRHSDVDVCLVIESNFFISALELSQKKLGYLKLFNLDIQIFQQLPLYIRIRILKEGRVIFCRDQDKLYKIAFDTIAEFNDYEHFYYDYLKEVESVR